MNLDLKVCSCGERVPANCVRCRECGAFLHDTTREFHEENFADNDVAEWKVSYNGQQFGPFSTNALRDAFATNFVPAEAMVWKPGLADWISVHRVSELLDQPNAQAPVEPTEPTSDGAADFELLEKSDTNLPPESTVDLPLDDLDDIDIV